MTHTSLSICSLTSLFLGLLPLTECDAADSPVVLWQDRAKIDKTSSSNPPSYQSMVLDKNGNPLVQELVPTPGKEGHRLHKFSGSSGKKIWSVFLAPAFPTTESPSSNKPVDYWWTLKMATDRSNHVITCRGGIQTQASGEKGPGIFIEKLSQSNGSVLWNKPIPGQAPLIPSRMVVDSRGDVLIAAEQINRFHSSSDYHPYIQLYKLSGKTGKLLWSKTQLDRFGRGDVCVDLLLDSKDNAFVISESKKSDTQDIDDQVEITKYASSTGSVLMQASQPGNAFSGVTVDSSGSIYLAATHLTSDGSSRFTDIIVVKYNPADGSKIWSQFTSQVKFGDFVHALALDSKEHVLLVTGRKNRSRPLEYRMYQIFAENGVVRPITTFKDKLFHTNETYQWDQSWYADPKSAFLTLGTMDQNPYYHPNDSYSSITLAMRSRETGKKASLLDYKIDGSLIQILSRARDASGNVVLAGSLHDPITLEKEHFLTKIVMPSNPEIDVKREGRVRLVDGKGRTDFGGGLIGLLGAWKSFTIRNIGNGPLKGIRVSVTGRDSADFQVLDLGATSLAPNESTTFRVQFKPRAKGMRTANVKIQSNDKDEGRFIIKVIGDGVKGAASTNPE